MIQNNFGKLYIGITEDFENRLNYHNSKRGAKFTKGKTKFYIAFLEPYPTLSAARKREIQIKKWRRDKKEVLIRKYKLGLTTKPNRDEQ